MTDTILSQIVEAGKPRRISELVSLAAEKTGYTPEDILGYSRKAHLAKTRQWVMWKAKHEGFTYQQIGRVLNRDHTTIMHGVRRIEAMQ